MRRPDPGPGLHGGGRGDVREGLHGAGQHLALLGLWEGDPDRQPRGPDGGGGEVPPRLSQVLRVWRELGWEDGDTGQGEQAILYEGL